MESLSFPSVPLCSRADVCVSSPFLPPSIPSFFPSFLPLPFPFPSLLPWAARDPFLFPLPLPEDLSNVSRAMISSPPPPPLSLSLPLRLFDSFLGPAINVLSVRLRLGDLSRPPTYSSLFLSLLPTLYRLSSGLLLAKGRKRERVRVRKGRNEAHL